MCLVSLMALMSSGGLGWAVRRVRRAAAPARLADAAAPRWSFAGYCWGLRQVMAEHSERGAVVSSVSSVSSAFGGENFSDSTFAVSLRAALRCARERGRAQCPGGGHDPCCHCPRWVIQATGSSQFAADSRSHGGKPCVQRGRVRRALWGEARHGVQRWGACRCQTCCDTCTSIVRYSMILVLSTIIVWRGY